MIVKIPAPGTGAAVSRSRRRPLLLAAATLTAGGLAACGAAGKAEPDGAAESGSTITVRATDRECALSRTEAAAGRVAFAVTNQGSKVNEFYVYAAGERVMGEVENIAPGLTRRLVVELPAGTYQTACKPGMAGEGIRGTLTVSGGHTPLATDGRLADAVASYQRYVADQAGALAERTAEFVAAVKAGDVARAKALYPVARTPWERIEPVAESFGDLDPAIDGREDALEPGQEFTGYHRLEKDLWVTGDLSGSAGVADRLLADVKRLVARVEAAKLSPLQLANGAKELLDEVASSKITGEEERYSHTDLWDFAANVEGSRAAIAALRAVLAEREPHLAGTLDERFAAVESALGRYRSGDGWRSHDELSRPELKELSDVINALAEPVSEVAGVVAR